MTAPKIPELFVRLSTALLVSAFAVVAPSCLPRSRPPPRKRERLGHSVEHDKGACRFLFLPPSHPWSSQLIKKFQLHPTENTQTKNQSTPTKLKNATSQSQTFTLPSPNSFFFHLTFLLLRSFLRSSARVCKGFFHPLAPAEPSLNLDSSQGKKLDLKSSLHLTSSQVQLDLPT